MISFNIKHNTYETQINYYKVTTQYLDIIYYHTTLNYHINEHLLSLEQV